MLIAALATTMLLSSQGVKPDHYSERWLCDLWAGAQCHATSCKKDGKDRCEAVSKACKDTSKKATVPDDRASKQSACARALLKTACGAAKPAECEGLM